MQVSRTETTNYIPQYLWDVITRPALDSCFWYNHDDVTKWKHFPRYLSFVRGVHRPPVCMYWIPYIHSFPLQWRHNERDGVSNHRRLDCLLSRFFRCRSKNTSKFRVTGLCEGNSPVTGEFPAQRTSSAKNVSIWWRHHALPYTSCWERSWGMGGWISTRRIWLGHPEVWTSTINMCKLSQHICYVATSKIGLFK